MLKKIMNIFGFGAAAIDFRIFTADLGVDYRDKLLAQKTEVFGGGATANCLVQVARLGGKALWLGKTGRDWISERILDQLETEGVDCSRVVQDPSRCSPFNVAVYAGDGKRRVGGFLLPNSLASISREEITAWCAPMTETDWAIVEVGEIPLNTTHEFCSAVKARGAKLMINIDLDPVRQCAGDMDTIDAIFRYADILVPNSAAAGSLYPDLSPDRLAGHLASVFEVITIVTAGAEGVYYCTVGASVKHQKAFPVPVVDTVGAGDAFHGGLLYALANRWDLARGIAFGSRCGAENCKTFGARTGMPGQADLKRLQVPLETYGVEK